MIRCPSCSGHGQGFQDEPPCHIPCPDCDGTGVDATDCAEELHALFFVTLGGPESRKHAEERKRKIRAVVAAHMRDVAP